MSFMTEKAVKSESMSYPPQRLKVSTVDKTGPSASPKDCMVHITLNDR